jgi:hypothetical protein
MKAYGETSFPDPGKFESVRCGYCDTEMSVQRNCSGPCCWAEAMSGSRPGRLHDEFICPHRSEEWHQKVHALIEEGRKFVCETLQNTCFSEANQVLHKMNKSPFRMSGDKRISLVEKEPPKHKKFWLQNRYQDSGWENLDKEFDDIQEAINTAYELCKDAIIYGMVRVVKRGNFGVEFDGATVIVEFPAGGYQ